MWSEIARGAGLVILFVALALVIVYAIERTEGLRDD